MFFVLHFFIILCLLMVRSCHKFSFQIKTSEIRKGPIYCMVQSIRLRLDRHAVGFVRKGFEPGHKRSQSTIKVAMRRISLKEAARRFPWLANATLYGCMFASGDLVHQLMAKNEQMDWKHTRNVAIVGFCFQGHFNYFWLRALEQRFPGKSVRILFKKLIIDQSFASPLATSVFYTGVSFLEGKEDVFEDWREKFFNTWKTGLMFWPFMQFINFALMPPNIRTSFMACCAFVWATFLCFSRQNGDGTAGVALAFIIDPRKTLEDLKEARKRSKLQKEDFWIHK